METPRVFPNYPMASADTEEREYARVGSDVATEGGNPGQSDDESPEGLEARHRVIQFSDMGLHNRSKMS
jgi:hypothetical protein